MQYKVCYIRLLPLLFVFSCAQKKNEQQLPVVNAAAIVKDFSTWWNYNAGINFSVNYISLDTAKKIITKEAFLRSLISGEYVPLKEFSTGSAITYALYKLGPLADSTIKEQIKQIGEKQLHYYQLEGTQLPGFYFTDIEGNVYNKETTKGKIVVIKTWFIHCKQCVEEIPELNEAIKPFKNRKDILFVSLAYDTRQQLKNFMAKTTFNYAAVPEQQTYLISQLKIYESPTHLVINREGIISKVIGSNYKDMIAYLKNEAL